MFKRAWNWLKSLFKKAPVVVAGPVDDNPAPPSSGDKLRKGDIFVDISRYETCDYETFKGKDMIFKATEGTSWVDPTMKRNIEECEARGIRYGTYHFYRTNKDPIAQAEHFINSMGIQRFKTCYHLPVLDYELTKGQTKEDLKKSLDDALKFVRYIYEKTGRKSRIYSGDYLMGYLDFPVEFLEYCESPWVARYHTRENRPKNLAPWSGLWAHQFTDAKYFIAGIGYCDCNVYYGD